MSYRFFPVVLVMVGLLFAASCVPIEKQQSSAQQAESHYILGVTALNEANPTEALIEFLEAEKYDPTDDEIQAGLARAYWMKQAYELAEQHFQKALKLNNNNPKYYNNLGALYLTMGRYDDAIATFQLAADNILFDRQDLAWTGIGLANIQKQDYVAAQAAYEKAMRINPRNHIAPFRLGELYYNQNRPVEALDMFTRTVTLAPGFADGHYWQGLVYMKMKETDKAKAAFQEVVRLAPQSDSARLAHNYLKILKN